MKTPKEKAKELVEKYRQYTPAEEELEYPYAIECAKIAVDEIIKEFEYNSKQDIKNGYWQEVKNELNKM